MEKNNKNNKSNNKLLLVYDIELLNPHTKETNRKSIQNWKERKMIEGRDWKGLPKDLMDRTVVTDWNCEDRKKASCRTETPSKSRSRSRSVAALGSREKEIEEEPRLVANECFLLCHSFSFSGFSPLLLPISKQNPPRRSDERRDSGLAPLACVACSILVLDGSESSVHVAEVPIWRWVWP